MRGLPVITLAGRSFAGPYLAPLWSAPKAPGLYAVLVPGWRLLMFHPIHFGHAADLSAPEVLKKHAGYAEWLSLAGTEWNLYIAACEMYHSSESERVAAHHELLAARATTIKGPIHAQL
jgi:hypothetical protein